MCIPGTINNVNTQGVFKLLKDGATMVTEGSDILNALGWEVVKDSKSNNETELTGTQKLVFDIIGVEPKGFDELQNLTKLETDELLTALTIMEMEGLVEQIEGDRYKRA